MNIQTESQALATITKITQKFNLPGTGYFGSADIYQAIDNLRVTANYPLAKNAITENKSRLA